MREQQKNMYLNKKTKVKRPDIVQESEADRLSLDKMNLDRLDLGQGNLEQYDPFLMKNNVRYCRL